MAEFLIFVGAAYCLVDFVLGVGLGRCVLPGLRCHACKEEHRRVHRLRP